MGQRSDMLRSPLKWSLGVEEIAKFIQVRFSQERTRGRNLLPHDLFHKFSYFRPHLGINKKAELLEMPSIIRKAARVPGPLC